MIVQIYEIQTPEEAAMLERLGVDHGQQVVDYEQRLPTTRNQPTPPFPRSATSP